MKTEECEDCGDFLYEKFDIDNELCRKCYSSLFTPNDIKPLDTNVSNECACGELLFSNFEVNNKQCDECFSAGFDHPFGGCGLGQD